MRQVRVQVTPDLEEHLERRSRELGMTAGGYLLELLAEDERLARNEREVERRVESNAREILGEV